MIGCLTPPVVFLSHPRKNEMGRSPMIKVGFRWHAAKMIETRKRTIFSLNTLLKVYHKKPLKIHSSITGAKTIMLKNTRK